MIFLTLGTQLPFDRLAQAVDQVASDLDEPIFGQIGATSYLPQHYEAEKFLSPQEFADHFSQARVVIAHAGMGTILAAMRAQKPVILMARKAALGEHRNDHQLATCAQMRKIEGVHIVETTGEIAVLLRDPNLTAMQPNDSPARDKLVARLRSWINA